MYMIYFSIMLINSGYKCKNKQHSFHLIYLCTNIPIEINNVIILYNIYKLYCIILKQDNLIRAKIRVLYIFC